MSRPDAHEPLLKGLLGLAAGESAAGDHPEEETLAQFASAELPSAERERLIAHLADCDQCRLVVAAVGAATTQSAAPGTIVDRTKTNAVQPRSSTPSWILATAAGLLLLIGGITAVLLSRGDTESAVYSRALAALEAGQFDEAQRDLEQAIAGGTTSPRLIALLAQAHRQMPRALALAHAGRLSDFGIEIGGVVARDPSQWPHRQGLKEAEAVLAGAEEDAAVLLNRGHLLLSRGDTRGAAAEFAKAERFAPDDSLVRLGQGLVAFLEDDLPRAESAFQRAGELDPQNAAAHINLAMTLQEQGKNREAVDAWQRILARQDIADQDRQKIRRELAALEGML